MEAGEVCSESALFSGEVRCHVRKPCGRRVYSTARRLCGLDRSLVRLSMDNERSAVDSQVGQL